MFRSILFRFSYLLLLLLFIGGCSNITKVFKSESPRDKYEEKIKNAGLLETALGKAWVEAGESALRDSISVSLPYKEEGYFFSDKADAAGFHFAAKRGEILNITVEIDTIRAFSIFTDLFALEAGSSKPERVDFASDGKKILINYKVDKDQSFILRLQPELLKGGRYTLHIKTSPSLSFPVSGKNGKAIGSIFGDRRDNGKRRHEGVDIFAHKGTPVLSASSGLVIRTGEDPLGGKIVLISDLKDLSFYYAHLDSQLVDAGTYVKEGQPIGLVGNTGNALYTPSHLHFGIYSAGHGAINPLPFINDIRKAPEDPDIDGEPVGGFARVKLQKTLLRSSMEKGSRIIMPLQRNSVFTIYAAGSNFCRIVLPDGRMGFLPNSAVEKMERPLMKKTFRKEQPVLDMPGVSGAALAYLPDDENLPLYGEFNDYYLVGYKKGFGWITK